MTSEQAMILAFHRKFGIPSRDVPTLIPGPEFHTREYLILEELSELKAAYQNMDLVGVYDALLDLKYVVEGAACAFGFDLAPGFQEVHRSNMTKVWPEGTPRELMYDSHGKYLKPTGYSPANLEPIVKVLQSGRRRFTDCAICLELSGAPQAENEVPDRILWEDDDFVVYPTVGCFVPGYLILSPKDHYQSFSYLPTSLLKRAQNLVVKITDMMYEVLDLDSPVFVAEHGSTMCQRGAACCDHAHLHLIPVQDLNEVLSEYDSVRSPDLYCEDLQTLSSMKDKPYLLAGMCVNLKVWDSSDGFSSQFCRKVAAADNDVSHKWNWRTHPEYDNMRQTIQLLKGPLSCLKL